MSTVSETGSLSADTLNFTYPNEAEPALRGVSLQVAPRQMLALVGPNGSGKTTLLRLLSGALRPESGGVTIDGQRLDELAPGRRAQIIAFVSQRMQPDLAFTVREIVQMGRSPYARLLRSESRADREATYAAIAACDLNSLEDRRFDELSGGEQQRTMIAMALAQEPAFLLLDEPTLHLDLSHQSELLELLAHLRESRSVTIIAVLHDLNLAALYFDRMAVLAGGQLVLEGQPDSVLANATMHDVFAAPLISVTHPEAGVPQLLLRRQRP